jgi:ABC-type glycerol-3-phosphate transport system permease component
MSKQKIVYSKGDKVFFTINYIFLSFCFLIVILPLINVISSSLSSPTALITGKVFILPVEPSLFAYKKIVTNPDLINGYLNSLFYTVVGTSVNIILTIMAAYPLSRKDFYGRNVITGMFVFTMLFSGGMIPNYLLVKNLHLYDTRWALIIPGALSVWNVMIARNFFQTTIPNELIEAAEIDGASDIKVIFSVVLPLSAPIIAVLSLFYAVGHWNSYFGGFLYLKSKNLFPLQVVLRNILLNAQIIETMADIPSQEQLNMMSIVEVLKYAIIVFASLPVILLYPIVQKHFVKGVMVGSLKG